MTRSTDNSRLERAEAHAVAGRRRVMGCGRLRIAVLRSVHHSSRQRIEAALCDSDVDARLERVIEAALPLNSEKRDEWSIWMAFLAHAVSSDALQAELKVRYGDWSALLAGVIGTDPRERHHPGPGRTHRWSRHAGATVSA